MHYISLWDHFDTRTAPRAPEFSPNGGSFLTAITYQPDVPSTP